MRPPVRPDQRAGCPCLCSRRGGLHAADRYDVHPSRDRAPRSGGGRHPETAGGRSRSTPSWRRATSSGIPARCCAIRACRTPRSGRSWPPGPPTHGRSSPVRRCAACPVAGPSPCRSTRSWTRSRRSTRVRPARLPGAAQAALPRGVHPPLAARPDRARASAELSRRRPMATFDLRGGTGAYPGCGMAGVAGRCRRPTGPCWAAGSCPPRCASLWPRSARHRPCPGSGRAAEPVGLRVARSCDHAGRAAGQHPASDCLGRRAALVRGELRRAIGGAARSLRR